MVHRVCARVCVTYDGVSNIDWGHHSLGSLIGNSYTVAVKREVSTFSPFITPHMFLEAPTLVACAQTNCCINTEREEVQCGVIQDLQYLALARQSFPLLVKLCP